MRLKHVSTTQTIPTTESEFLPIRRGEAPYYANLNRPAQSAYDYTSVVAEIQSWGGLVSILDQVDQTHVFKVYEIVAINDSEQMIVAPDSPSLYTRYGIVVAEAEFDSVANLYVNTVVCTFCPNFVYMPGYAPTDAAGIPLKLDLSNTTSFLSDSPSGSMTRTLAQKTGLNSIFFSGTVDIFGA